MATRIGTLFLVTAVAGFLVGVRATGGTLPVFDAPETAALREADPIRGGFWRPVGSDAVRPVVRLEVRTWEPAR
ncbi:MAG: hypothetical protein ABFS41_13160 [Myxococcota bacterium]